jgi:hypothetical protein
VPNSGGYNSSVAGQALCWGRNSPWCDAQLAEMLLMALCSLQDMLYRVNGSITSLLLSDNPSAAQWPRARVAGLITSILHDPALKAAARRW